MRSIVLLSIWLASTAATIGGSTSVGRLLYAAETKGRDSEFRGQVIVERGGRRIFDGGVGRRFPYQAYVREAQKTATLDPGFDRFTFRDEWRWASVTKQIVAVLIMQQVEAGKIELDQPLSRYLPGMKSPIAKTATVRQLLQHRAGLPNPDDSPAGKDGFPDYYQPNWAGSRDPLNGYCGGPVKGSPGGRWEYNNCDYIVAGALLQVVSGKPWQQLVMERIAKPLGLRSLKMAAAGAATTPGFIDDHAEPPIELASFGAAASLTGTAADLVKFDRALLDGKLINRGSRNVLWNGDPALGYMALGQWVFTVPLKGCAAPVRIVERRGEIGGVGVRNFILPDHDTIVVAFTNRGGFDFGEIWQGKGFSYDLLSAAACPSA